MINKISARYKVKKAHKVKRYSRNKSTIPFRKQAGYRKVDKCITFFGKHIGYIEDVPAYSNCANSVESNIHNIVSHNDVNIYSGIQWQCVEYVRRYLITKIGVTFGSVVGAEDVFTLKTVKSIKNGREYTFKTFKNGINCKKEDLPKVNDVIIWARNETDTPYGHIATILKTEANQIFIGEQNWSNDLWMSPSYSRILILNTNMNRCTIEDRGYIILGWKRVIIE